MNSHSTVIAKRVVIIGGGPAGTCCAIRLKQNGMAQVTLIEATNYQQIRIGESIPPESRQISHELGLWAEFLLQQHQPCTVAVLGGEMKEEGLMTVF